MAWLGHTALWQPRAKRRPTEREGRVRGQGGNERMGGRVKGQNQETEMSNYIQNSKKTNLHPLFGELQDWHRK